MLMRPAPIGCISLPSRLKLMTSEKGAGGDGRGRVVISGRRDLSAIYRQPRSTPPSIMEKCDYMAPQKIVRGK